MLNNPEDMLSLVLRGALGRSGRKTARRSLNFLTGRGGFLTAGTLMTAAGIAWGIFDSLKGQEAGALTGATVGGSVLPPPIPVIPGTAVPAAAMDSVIRVVRLAVSAARADGTFTEQERAIILARAKEAGLESAVEAELAATYPLNEIVERGTHDQLLARDGRYRQLYDKQYKLETNRFINPGEDWTPEAPTKAPAMKAPSNQL